MMPTSPHAFNRTSMESKQNVKRRVRVKHVTFNRTSMESKLIYSLGNGILRTFNRTSMESKLFFTSFLCFKNTLLIEPVWNRNLGVVEQMGYEALAFNRTSMESKHLYCYC